MEAHVTLLEELEYYIEEHEETVFSVALIGYREVSGAGLNEVWTHFMQLIQLHRVNCTEFIGDKDMYAVYSILYLFMAKQMRFYLDVGKTFARKIEKLLIAFTQNDLFMKPSQCNPDKGLQMLSLLANYYFFYRHNHAKATEFIEFALTRARKNGNPPWQFLFDLFMMQHIVGNYKECKVIINRVSAAPITVIRKSFHNLVEDISAATESADETHRCFNANDTKMHRKLIKSAIKDERINGKQKYEFFSGFQFESRDDYYQFNKNLRECLFDSMNFNIIYNCIKMKQCNYIKCRTKSIRKFKVCRRCKSVFYCSRHHQKLDWGLNENDHKKYCAENDTRNYNL